MRVAHVCANPVSARSDDICGTREVENENGLSCILCSRHWTRSTTALIVGFRKFGARSVDVINTLITIQYSSAYPIRLTMGRICDHTRLISTLLKVFSTLLMRAAGVFITCIGASTPFVRFHNNVLIVLATRGF